MLNGSVAIQCNCKKNYLCIQLEQALSWCVQTHLYKQHPSNSQRNDKRAERGKPGTITKLNRSHSSPFDTSL